MPCTPEAAIRPGPREAVCASLTVPGRVEWIRFAADFIVRAARSMDVPPATDSLFEAAIVEALNNALEHGNPTERPDAVIVCEIERVRDRLTVRILGQGPEFALPRSPGPPSDAADATTLPEGGFGLPIIQAVFPTVHTIARPGEFGLEMSISF